MPKGYSNSNPDINSLGSHRNRAGLGLDSDYSAPKNSVRAGAQSNHAAGKIPTIPTIESVDMYRRSNVSGNSNYSRGGSRTQGGSRAQGGSHAHAATTARREQYANQYAAQNNKQHRRTTQNNLRKRNYEEYSRQTSGFIRTLAIILVTIAYLLVAISGVVAPFLPGFNFGALAPWQVYFARFWLAIVLLGGIYAVAVNLFHIRSARFFQGNKALKIFLFIVADVAISFVVIRLVCLF